MFKNNKKNSHLKKDHLNYDQNKPIGINHLNILFDGVSNTKWYLQCRKRILIIKLFAFNKKNKLLIEKQIFLNYFNQFYNFDYDWIYSNNEFDTVYNKKMNLNK